MPLVKVRLLACIVGQIISMQAVLGKNIQLKTRDLYRCIMSRASWNAPVMLAVDAVRGLEYWRTNVSSMNAAGQYVSPNLDSEILIYVDASGDGYGGYASYFDTVSASLLAGFSFSSYTYVSNGPDDSCYFDMDGSSKHIQWSELGSDDQVYSLGESADSETLSKVSIGVQESDLAPGRADTLETGNDAQISDAGHVHECMHEKKSFWFVFGKNAKIS